MSTTSSETGSMMAGLVARARGLGDHYALYALVDGAHESFIHRRILLSGGTYRCLYRGQLSSSHQEVAPYLVHLNPEKNAMEWIIDEGIPNNWASFFASARDIDFLQNHFRKFLTVRREDGQKLYFRFYDPRVIPLIAETDILEKLCEPGISFLNPTLNQNSI